MNSLLGEILLHSNEHKNDRVLIIDGTNTYIRVWASMPDISSGGEHVGGVLGFLRSLALNVREFSPTRCIVVFDSKGGSLRRKKLYPDYKGKRTGTVSSSKITFPSPEEEKLSMKNQFSIILQCLTHLPLHIVAVDHIEADDSIAYLCTNYFTDSKKVRIVSTDRDFLQLVNDRIEVYSPVKKVLYDEKKIKEEYGLIPQNYLLYRVIDRDTSDNIVGVSGIGRKTLLKYFPEIAEKPIDKEYLLSRSEEEVKNSKKPKKIFTSLLEHKDVINLNYQLMQLQDVDISLTSKDKIVSLVETPCRFNIVGLRKILIREYLMNHFKDFERWAMSSFSNLNAWTR